MVADALARLDRQVATLRGKRDRLDAMIADAAARRAHLESHLADIDAGREPDHGPHAGAPVSGNAT